jgi:hypothetical protein
MTLRYRRTQYEDLPAEIRAYIIVKLREIKTAVATVFQKYTRGRLPRLAWTATFRERPVRIGSLFARDNWVGDVLRQYRDHETRMQVRVRIGGEGQPQYSPYNLMRRSP